MDVAALVEDVVLLAAEETAVDVVEGAEASPRAAETVEDAEEDAEVSRPVEVTVEDVSRNFLLGWLVCFGGGHSLVVWNGWIREGRIR